MARFAGERPLTSRALYVAPCSNNDRITIALDEIHFSAPGIRVKFIGVLPLFLEIDGLAPWLSTSRTVAGFIYRQANPNAVVPSYRRNSPWYGASIKAPACRRGAIKSRLRPRIPHAWRAVWPSESLPSGPALVFNRNGKDSDVLCPSRQHQEIALLPTKTSAPCSMRVLTASRSAVRTAQ